MQLLEVSPDSFPETMAVIDDAAAPSLIEGLESVVIFGGGARSALLEATTGVVRPLRDYDLAVVGDHVSDESFIQLHHLFNPGSPDQTTAKIMRFPHVNEIVGLNTDFTINESALCLGQVTTLMATRRAVTACERKIITPTQARLEKTEKLERGGEATQRLFLRSRSGVPTRAAYFTAVLRSAGLDFTYDLENHPQPKDPSETHTFYLGLVLRKTLMMDEIERGPGNTTASKLLFEIFREMNLVAGPLPKTTEDIIAKCEQYNDEHPQLTFHGSEIAARVRHTDKLPKAKVS